MLAEEGASGVRIDRIAARLGLSKGSFHHHFAGAAGYKRALLEHFEQMSTEMLDEAIAGAGDAGVHAVLDRLTRMVGPGSRSHYRPELEVAVRAWATSDEDVRAVQGRIDEARVAALSRVWRPYVGTDADARTAALLPYLVSVGAAVVSPPVSATELQRVYEILLRLVPEGKPARS